MPNASINKASLPPLLMPHNLQEIIVMRCINHIMTIINFANNKINRRVNSAKNLFKMDSALIKRNANSLMVHINLEKIVKLTQNTKQNNVVFLSMMDAVCTEIDAILFIKRNINSKKLTLFNLWIWDSYKSRLE